MKTFSEQTTEMQLGYNSNDNLKTLGRQPEITRSLSPPPIYSSKPKTRPDVLIKKYKISGKRVDNCAPVAPHLFKKNEAFKTYLEIKKTFSGMKTYDTKEVVKSPR